VQLGQPGQLLLAEGQISAEPADVVGDDAAKDGRRSSHAAILESDDFASTDDK